MAEQVTSREIVLLTRSGKPPVRQSALNEQATRVMAILLAVILLAGSAGVLLGLLL